MKHKVEVPSGFIFTKQAPGAMLNNTEVEKVNSEEGDNNPDGTKGIIIGSIGNGQPMKVPGLRPVIYMYFVIWDTDFETPIACVDYKVKALE